jgi:WD40 repeat protein
MTDRLGQHLGNYRLIRLLGQGGFAEVHQAEHVLLGTTAAIKVLHTQISQEEMMHFQQEARLLASLKHPHIVRVYDFGIDGQTPYLVMDYAAHGTLRTRHSRGSRLPLPTVVEYVSQIAEALQYAHDRNVVHRDVKPENILLDENNKVKLSDFGIALIVHSSRQQSMQSVIGTIAYMSPEQIQGKPLSASDQYALGVIVYEWLSGLRPFQGSFLELCAQHLFAPPPSLAEQVPTLDPAVERVVLTALSKDPARRFAGVRAFAAALQQASQGILPDECSPLADRSSVSTALFPPVLNATVQAAPARQHSYPATEVQIPPLLSDLPLPTRTIGKRVVSRRALLAGVVGGVVLTGVGGISLFWRSHSPPSQHVSSHKPATSPQGQLFLTYRGHSDQVAAVTWSPDGQRVASCSRDSTVRVWNASDGSQPFIYKGHADPVNAVVWAPNGQRIASGSWDNTVQIWNASDGSNTFIYQGHSNAVLSVAWSPHGQRIASGSWDNTVQVWNARDGSNAFIYQRHSAQVISVTWSPDGTRIASGSWDNTVQVWNASDGSNGFTYKGHINAVASVAWAPDGQRIASGSLDATVQVWNASDGSHLFTYQGHAGPVNAVAWAPDGQRIASGSADKTVQVWNASDGRHGFTYQGHAGPVNAVAWAPDGQRIASGSGDNIVQVWQAV